MEKLTGQERLAQRQFLHEYDKWEKCNMVFSLTEVLDKCFSDETTKELLSEVGENLKRRQEQDN